MQVATAFPEEQAIQLYDLVGAPASRLGRWVVRRRRGINDSALRATAHGLIADFEELLSLPPFRFRARLADEREEPSDDVLDATEMGALLVSVRRGREDILGAVGQALERALRARLPDLAAEYEERRADVVTYLGDLERMLVLLGAGSEDDAEVGMDLIPMPDDVQPGPSVPHSEH